MQMLLGKGTKSSNSQKDAKCLVLSSFLRMEDLKGTIWEERKYLDWICNFAEIDHESEENFQGVQGGEGWPEILILGNDINSTFLSRGCLGTYRTSLCWGTKADLGVRSQDPWKGFGITTNVPAWWRHHLRLDSVRPAWVTCPTNLPVWLFQCLRALSFIKLPSLHLLIIFALTNPLPPMQTYLLVPPSHSLVSFWPLLPRRWPAPQVLSSDALDIPGICFLLRNPALPGGVAPHLTHSTHFPHKTLPWQP